MRKNMHAWHSIYSTSFCRFYVRPIAFVLEILKVTFTKSNKNTQAYIHTRTQPHKYTPSHPHTTHIYFVLCEGNTLYGKQAGLMDTMLL